MNILFMGTPSFSVTCLKQLIADEHKVVGVFTQPDKPKGRGNIITQSAVKTESLASGIEVYQPEKIKCEQVVQLVEQISPDMIVVVAYGKILPKQVLAIPTYGCINIHASLLPKYRGAAPIQWSVINGETQTGVTSMLMDEGMDTGDILLTEKTIIDINENSGDLFKRMSLIGASLLSKTIDGLLNGHITPVKQIESEATYAPMLQKSMCRINWKVSAEKIHNLIRGLAPFLYASTIINGKVVRIISSAVCDWETGDAGEVVENGETLIVACADKTAIRLETLQAEGRRAMPAKEFLLGNRIEKHLILA